MSEADYYPMGAYRDPSAPYNQVEVPVRDFDLTISQSLSKDVTVCTNDYAPEYDEEDGRTYINTENTDWEKAYKEDHYTPLQLIQMYKQVLEEQLESFNGIDDTFAAKLQIRRIKQLIEECESWIEDETVITQS
jgi:hypothetical protein